MRGWPRGGHGHGYGQAIVGGIAASDERDRDLSVSGPGRFSARHQRAFGAGRGDTEVRSVQRVNKRRTQIKVLYWQRSGFCLWLKRLEEERFKWPTHLPAYASTVARPPVVTLTEEQFLWLLEGLDLKHLKPHRALEYRSVL